MPNLGCNELRLTAKCGRRVNDLKCIRSSLSTVLRHQETELGREGNDPTDRWPIIYMGELQVTKD